MAEIIVECRVIDKSEFLILGVKLVVGLLLELVSEPCRNVALLVSP